MPYVLFAILQYKGYLSTNVGFFNFVKTSCVIEYQRRFFFHNILKGRKENLTDV